MNRECHVKENLDRKKKAIRLISCNRYVHVNISIVGKRLWKHSPNMGQNSCLLLHLHNYFVSLKIYEV